MKQKIIKSKLLRIFILVGLFACFFSCEKEDISNNDLVINQEQNNYQLKKVRFSQLKKNKKAFDRLVEARIKKNPSLEYRGIYNSDFGVFVDTTNITLIESEDTHSYTFQIINENIQEFENLVLNYKNNGDYSAYISKYNLNQEQINNLIDSGSLTNIAPTSISEVNSTMSIPVSGNGSDCVDIVTYSTNMCYNSQGNLMESNGELENGCVGMSFPVEHMIMVIDADCMSGGGPGGYDGSGGDNGGYNPGSGGTGGFGGNTGGTGGNTGGNTGGTGGNTGNPPNDGGNSNNPIEIVDEGNNPIVTTPVININKTEVKLLNSLTPEQNDWWNDPSTSQETKDDIINYLNENNDNQSQAEEAIDFVKELIDTSIDLDINVAEIWFNDYELFRNQMSDSERAIFDNMLRNRQMWYMGAAYKAKTMAEELYPDSLHNGKGDAYRHALWNGLSSLLIGNELTNQLTTAHENKPPSYVYNNMEIAMDLYNNDKGRVVASFSNLTNIFQNILNYTQLGFLRYLNNLDPNGFATYNSQLIPTNQ